MLKLVAIGLATLAAAFVVVVSLQPAERGAEKGLANLKSIAERKA